MLAGAGGHVPTVLVMHGNQRIIGLTVGARRHRRDMIRAIGAEGIRPIIDRHFPLEQIADAFRHQEPGRHSARSAWISDHTTPEVRRAALPERRAAR